MAVKKAAEESARKGWESERQRFVQQTRTLRAQLDVAAEKNQKLLSEKNALQVRYMVWCDTSRGWNGESVTVYVCFHGFFVVKMWWLILAQNNTVLFFFFFRVVFFLVVCTFMEPITNYRVASRVETIVMW